MDRDDTKNAKLLAERVGFEDMVFHIERGDLRDILEHPNPTVTPASASSWSDARTMCTWCRSRLRPPVWDAAYGEVSP